MPGKIVAATPFWTCVSLMVHPLHRRVETSSSQKEDIFAASYELNATRSDLEITFLSGCRARQLLRVRSGLFDERDWGGATGIGCYGHSLTCTRAGGSDTSSHRRIGNGMEVATVEVRFA